MDESVWNSSFIKYRTDERVSHLVFVKWRGGSDALVFVYGKNPDQKNRDRTNPDQKNRDETNPDQKNRDETNPDAVWVPVLKCNGYVGKCGLKADKKESDCATPIGDFGILTAFGIRENPGTKLDWLDVTEDLWCPDCDGPDYNKIVSTKNGGMPAGEHLIDFSPQYDYALFLDYNKECIPQAGSAIFFHCTGPKKYTGGCIAVSEENMKDILGILEKDDRVIIEPDQ